MKIHVNLSRSFHDCARRLRQCIGDDLLGDDRTIFGVADSFEPGLGACRESTWVICLRLRINSTQMSSSRYPNVSLMNSIFGPARLSGASNEITYVERASKNARNSCDGARSCEGCAAINHDGHGVGTEPIYVCHVGICDRGYRRCWLVGRAARRAIRLTYKSHLACIDKRFGGEPLPHKCAGGSVVDRTDQPVNIVVD
jgi:hypothetical protein